MGKVHLAGRAFIPEPEPLGTIFTVYDDIWNGSEEEESSDIWQVPLGAAVGDAERITSAINGVYGTGVEFYDSWAVPSPDRSMFFCQYTNDGAVPGIGDADRWLAVMNADGSGRVFANEQQSERPCWLGDDYILFAENTTQITRVDADGTGEVDILTKSNIHGFDGAPDGSKVAYVAIVGVNNVLGVCNPDGSGDTTLVASGGVSGTGPLWTLDSSQIVFRRGTGVDIINADGTGQTTIVTTLGSAHWYVGGMASDRLWYTDRSSAMYHMAYLMLDGSGFGRTSPEYRLSQSDGRGVPVWDEAQGRVFSTLWATGATPEEIFSVLPDGSDYRTHFVALEEDWSAPGENFQSLYWRD